MVPIRGLLIDLSGTLHIDTTPTRNASLAIKRLREANIPLRFVSNTSKESRSSLLTKMLAMELDVREEELFTSLSAVRDLVVSRNLNPLYLLSKSAQTDFPPSSPLFDSVVVGLAPERLNYSNMNEAFRLLSGETTGRKDLPLIATHKALYYRSRDGELSIGPGPFISGLEEATGIKALVVGKPTLQFYEIALKSLEREGITREDWTSIGMIGDDKIQDVGVGPFKLGLQRFLVKTGKFRAGDEELLLYDEEGKSTGGPTWCGDDFDSVVDFILKDKRVN